MKTLKDWLIPGQPSVAPRRQLGVDNFPLTIEQAVNGLNSIIREAYELGFTYAGQVYADVGPQKHELLVFNPRKLSKSTQVKSDE